MFLRLVFHKLLQKLYTLMNTVRDVNWELYIYVWPFSPFSGPFLFFFFFFDRWVSFFGMYNIFS